MLCPGSLSVVVFFALVCLLASLCVCYFVCLRSTATTAILLCLGFLCFCVDSFIVCLIIYLVSSVSVFSLICLLGFVDGLCN